MIGENPLLRMPEKNLWLCASVAGSGQGIWKVLFDPVANVHHVYTVRAVLKSHAPITLSNVLFGDVWICSGQSNMKLPVEQVLYTVSQKKHPRHFRL